MAPAIPRNLHYIWLGPDPMPDWFRRLYLPSWRLHFPQPQWRWRFWGNHNLPQEAGLLRLIDAQNWSAASDWLRQWVLYTCGGVYLDLDVEVRQSLEPLLGQAACTLGWEGPPWKVNSAVALGAPQNSFSRRVLDSLDQLPLPVGPVAAGPDNLTRVVQEIAADQHRNLHANRHAWLPLTDGLNAEQLLLLPKACFYPYNWNEAYNPQCLQPETYTLQHWKESWR